MNKIDTLIAAGWRKTPYGCWRDPVTGHNRYLEDALEIHESRRCPGCGLWHEGMCDGRAVSHE